VLPSITCTAVDPGSPVSLLFDVAVETPASRLRTSSDARSLRRNVNRALRSRADASVNSRIVRGSGSLRQRSSGSVRSRVMTIASGVVADTPVASLGRLTTSG
jgi:hypothetical protein